MEIVLATNGLVGIGGSETYLLTVAEQLQRLGHEVTVHAAEGGAMSELHARRAALRVAIGEAGAPREACDALLVQDAAMAYALADRWPETPQVFRAPSAYHDFQSPPQLPGVVAVVVVCSDRIARHARSAGRRARDRAAAPSDRHQAAEPARRDPRAPAASGAARQLRRRGAAGSCSRRRGARPGSRA